MKKFSQRAFILSALRRASYRYPARNAAIAAARVERGVYRCAHCERLYGRKDIQIDHVKPVINPTTGWTYLPDGREDWNPVIYRMLCELPGWQVLCRTCHRTKSVAENALRKKKPAR